MVLSPPNQTPSELEGICGVAGHFTLRQALETTQHTMASPHLNPLMTDGLSC